MTHSSLDRSSRRRIGAAVLASLAAFIPVASRSQSSARRPNKVVFQVSDADPAKWGLALNNAYNVQAELGADTVEMEIVVYGPGIGMLKKGSAVDARVASALKGGIKIIACENTMRAQKLTKDDMLAEVGYVPAGVVEIMKRQQQGYAYVRP